MSLSAEEKIRRLQRALEFGGNTHSVGHVVELLKNGKARLFEQDDGCLIAEIVSFPLLKTVNFWLLSGVLADVLALEDQVLDWGRAEGATIATACGRKGWGRVAYATGWRPWHMTYHKHLGGDRGL